MKQNFFCTFTLFFKVLWIKWSTKRDWLIELVAVKILFPLAGLIQPKSNGQLKIETLVEMPKGTFGRELGDHMRRHKIDFLIGFEEHDMKHLLLGFPLSVPGEMRLSAFEFGAGNRSLMTLAVFYPAWILAPELWSQLKQDYLDGKENKHTKKIHLKSMLGEPMENVKKALSIQKYSMTF